MQTHPIWIDELDPDERRCLSPGFPEEIERRPDVLVVGGGMLGVSTALTCSREGLGKVVLLESDAIGSGPSGRAVGLLIPEIHVGADPEPVIALGRRSLQMWKQLGAEMPEIGLRPLDVLVLESIAERFADKQFAEAIEADDVARLVPGLAIRTEATLVRGQARLNPLRALSVMASALPEVATGVVVTSVRLSGNRVIEVTTSEGTFSPGSVVFCTGGPPDFFQEKPLPLSRVRGHIIVTDPVPQRLPGMVEPLCTQLPDGRLIAGGTLDFGETSPEVDERTVASMRGSLLEALPWLEKVPISHAWVCFRPLHPDYLPVVDRVRGVENAWFTSGHYRTGIIMGPAVGAEFARWIKEGSESFDFAEFRSDRAQVQN
jgi:glycine/D-amino acid oxidase-like deaminating enzyme